MEVMQLTNPGREALDLTAPDHGVEVLVRNDGKVLWVNVDGICRLRICQIPELLLNDERETRP